MGINKETLDKFSGLPEIYQEKISTYINEMYKDYLEENFVLTNEEIKELDQIKIDMSNGKYTRHEDIDWDAE